MTKEKIIKLIDVENNVSFLGYESDGNVLYPISDTAPNPTLEELADFCDSEAESRNNHDFVGCHRILAAMLFSLLGREKATEVMAEIAAYGGLDGMSGHFWGRESAFGDFGIKDCWSDWRL